MASKTQVLLTGATGYIGGTVLEKFLSRPDASSFEFTVLVRDAAKAEKFRAFGVNVVVGSHSEVPLMERLASETDVVIATADCDDLVAAKATLAGLKKRFEATGIPPIFINTSGTGVLVDMDTADGINTDAVVYDDSDPQQIATLPETRIHRNVDLAITDADVEGYIKSYIILPSAIYGLAKTRFVPAGLQNRRSIMIPRLLPIFYHRGRAGIVGKGLNVWPSVDIHEAADLYSVLWDAITSSPPHPAAGHGRDGYYFAANGDFAFYQVTKAIGEELVAAAPEKVAAAEPTEFGEDELAVFGPHAKVFGSNSRCVATHGRAIGWKPVKTTKDLLGSLKAEVEIMLSEIEAAT